jgi:threonine-phosphate decarboxylase
MENELVQNNNIIDLASKTNFIKPQLNVDLNRLDLSKISVQTNLYDLLSKKYTIDKNEITFFSSHKMAIQAIYNYFKLDYCTVYVPSINDYKSIININNHTYDKINLFTHINRAVKNNSLIIFENPSTVNGQLYDIESHLKAWCNIGCTVIIDEQYLDFTNYKSLSKYVNIYKNIYVLKSFDNFYSTAGIEASMLISNDDNIQNIKLLNKHITFNTLSSSYLYSILSDKAFHKTTKAINIKNHLLLKVLLEKYFFINKVYHSDVNFMLVQLKNIKANILCSYLYKHNILIDDCSSYDFLDDSYVSITVGSEKDILYLKKALDKISF